MNDVFWINGTELPHLAIVLRPRGDDWLEGELLRIKQSGVQTVVSLLEPFEADLLGLSGEKSTAEQVGLQFLSYPIPDTQVPTDVPGFRQFVAGIANRLAAGESVGVHCRGCIGRATITAACALIHLGLSPRDSLTAIARARGVQVPDTPEQEDWILGYSAQL